MKILLSNIMICVLVSFTFSAAGQDHSHCGFDDLFTFEERYTMAQRNAQRIAQSAQENSTQRRQSISVPVVGHALRSDLGAPSATQADLQAAVDSANRYLAAADIQLVLCNDITYTTNEDWFNYLKRSDHSEWANLVHVNGVVNLYIFNKGQSDFGFYGTVVIRKIRINEKTLVHEFGHTFGQIHTFQNTDILNPEAIDCPMSFHELVIRNVNLSLPYPYPNCSRMDANTHPYDTYPYEICSSKDLTAGDLLCDTPADANRLNHFQTYNCAFDDVPSPTGKDLNGMDFTPDVTNFMSYYGECRNSFSGSQMIGMRAVASTLNNFTNCDPRDDLVQEVNEKVVRMPSGTGIIDVSVSVENFTDDDCNTETGLDCVDLATDRFGSFYCNFAQSGFARANLTKEGTWLDGVTSFDLVLISRHSLGTAALDGWSQIAADVNNSGSVTVADLTLLRQLILYSITELPEGNGITSPWRFFPEFIPDFAPEHFVPNFLETPFNIPPSYPYPYPDYLQSDWCYEVPDPNFELMGFHGVKVGDVNGSADVNGFNNGSNDRSPASLALSFPYAVDANQSVTVSVTADNFEDISAFSLGLFIDPTVLQVESIIPGSLPNYQLSDFGITQLSEGKLRTLWLAPSTQGHSLSREQALFHLNLRTLAPLNDLLQHLQLREDILGAEFINSQPLVIENQLHLNIAEQAPSPQPNADHRDLRVAPNPFTDELIFQLNAPQAEVIQLSIFDILGRLILTQSYEVQLGQQQFKVNQLSQLPPGTFWYQLRGEQWEEQGRLIHR
ncbi:MAG: T9SS type A sorting domain-containing protein [Bacteroidota bacterium]